MAAAGDTTEMTLHHLIRMICDESEEDAPQLAVELGPSRASIRLHKTERRRRDRDGDRQSHADPEVHFNLSGGGTQLEREQCLLRELRALVGTEAQGIHIVELTPGRLSFRDLWHETVEPQYFRIRAPFAFPYGVLGVVDTWENVKAFKGLSQPGPGHPLPQEHHDDDEAPAMVGDTDSFPEFALAPLGHDEKSDLLCLLRLDTAFQLSVIRGIATAGHGATGAGPGGGGGSVTTSSHGGGHDDDAESASAVSAFERVTHSLRSDLSLKFRALKIGEHFKDFLSHEDHGAVAATWLPFLRAAVGDNVPPELRAQVQTIERMTDGSPQFMNTSSRSHHPSPHSDWWLRDAVNRGLYLVTIVRPTGKWRTQSEDHDLLLDLPRRSRALGESTSTAAKNGFQEHTGISPYPFHVSLWVRSRKGGGPRSFPRSTAYALTATARRWTVPNNDVWQRPSDESGSARARGGASAPDKSMSWR